MMVFFWEGEKKNTHTDRHTNLCKLQVCPNQLVHLKSFPLSLILSCFSTYIDRANLTPGQPLWEPRRNKFWIASLVLTYTTVAFVQADLTLLLILNEKVSGVQVKFNPVLLLLHSLPFYHFISHRSCKRTHPGCSPFPFRKVYCRMFLQWCVLYANIKCMTSSLKS